MGGLSLVLAVLGAGVMVWHFITHDIILGIACTVLFLAAFIIGLVEMRKKSKQGDLLASMKNFAMLGHGMAGTLVIVGGVMCAIANFMHK